MQPALNRLYFRIIYESGSRHISEKIENGKKITLERLSKETGLSVGFLSQFERGLTSIAIDTLEKIAAVFEVGIDYFISPPKKTDSSVILKSHALEISDIISSNIILRTMNNNIADKALYPRLIEILPLAHEEDITTYTHEGEEFYLCS